MAVGYSVFVVRVAFVHASTASGCIKPKRVRNLPPMNGVAGASPKTDVVCFCRPAGIGRLLL